MPSGKSKLVRMMSQFRLRVVEEDEEDHVVLLAVVLVAVHVQEDLRRG